MKTKKDPRFAPRPRQSFKIFSLSLSLYFFSLFYRALLTRNKYSSLGPLLFKDLEEARGKKYMRALFVA
jgi:hypothetical protein